jgi:hypothetical protein
MGMLFSSIFHLFIAIFGIILGVVGLLVGAVLSFEEFLLAGPFIILLVVLGLIFWHPLLWLVLIGGIFYLIRINRKERYIEIKRD